MAVLEVLRLGNPLLRERSLPVEDQASLETKRLCRDLEDTLGHWIYQVPRAVRIRVAYQDLDGNEKIVEAEGDLSELLQHEIDHLDGVLAIDRLVDIKTVCAREEYEKGYRKVRQWLFENTESLMGAFQV